MIVTRPRADGPLATAGCTAAEAVGDLVYIHAPKSGADYTVRKADITDFNKMPAAAVVIYKISATRAVIQFQGETDLYTGLTPGRNYWVSDAGVPTLTPPTVTGGQRKYWQSIGIATDSGRIRLEFEKDLKTRVG
jgi:hypothetical protein